jgi:hypothetical protein
MVSVYLGDDCIDPDAGLEDIIGYLVDGLDIHLEIAPLNVVEGSEWKYFDLVVAYNMGGSQ